jgi:hypothetical protein
LGKRIYNKLANDNGVVNFATSRNLTVKSAMFPHQYIHKFTWTSPDRWARNKIDHILLDRSTLLLLVAEENRERLAVSKQITRRIHIERFNLKKLNAVESKEQYRVDISNMFVALEN